MKRKLGFSFAGLLALCSLITPCLNLATASINATMSAIKHIAEHGPKPSPSRPEPSPSPSPLSTPSSGEAKLPLQVTFRYNDSPTKHGWKSAESVEFKHFSDDYVKDAIQLWSPDPYALDYEIPKEAQKGTLVQVVSQQKSEVQYYVGVEVADANGHKRNVWLKISSDQEGLANNDGELNVYTQTLPLAGPRSPWSTFQVNARDVVENMYSSEGWTYCRMLRVRVRQNVVLASITISK